MRSKFLLQIILFIFLRFNCVVFGNVNFTILHINDLCSRFDEQENNGKFYGGFSRIAYKVKELKNAAPNPKSVLFLNTGDTFSGTIWFTLRRWEIVSELLNLLPLDAMSIGEHEFYDSVKNLTKFVKNSQFPILSCNTNFPISILNKIVKSWVIFPVKAIRIGVIGVTTTQSKILANARSTTFYDEIDTIKYYANYLEDIGVEVIIVLSNGGYNYDFTIANSVDNIDIIVGGGSNTFLYTGKSPDLEKPIDNYPSVVYKSSGQKVLIVQAYAYGKYLGLLNVEVSYRGEIIDFSGNPILLSSDIEKDSQVEEIIQKHKQLIENETSAIIGRTTKELTHKGCRIRECIFGNLVTDSFIEYIKDNYEADSYWTSCSIAIVNSGSIKGLIPIGNVSIGNVYESIPYYESLIIVQVSWQVLLGALEVGFGGAFDSTTGEFLQISGMIVRIDTSRRSGSRVLDVQVRCQKCKSPKFEPLGLESTYRIVTNRYLAYGGDYQDELQMYKRSEVLLNIVDTQAVISYFRKYNVVDVNVEGRIIINCGLKVVFNHLFFIFFIFLLLIKVFNYCFYPISKKIILSLI